MRVFVASELSAFLAAVMVAGCSTDVQTTETEARRSNSEPTTLEIMETYPEDYDFEVIEDTIVSVTFNKDMDPKTINVTTFVLVDQTYRPIPADVTYDSKTKTARLSPLKPLTYGTVYTADVTHRVRDATGRHLNGGYQWVFSVREQPLSAHLKTQPVDQATDVSVKTRLVVELHGAVDTEKFDPASFTLTDIAAVPVAGSVDLISAFDGVLTFTPDAELLPGAVYNAKLSKGVPLLSGATLDQDVLWSFTTAERNSTLQWGNAPLDRALGAAVDASGSVFTAGLRGYAGSDGLPVRELVVTKSDSDGRLSWTKQFESSEGLIEGRGIALDSQGDVIVTGLARGDVDASSALGKIDAVVLKLSSATGEIIWVTHLGTETDDYGFALAVDVEDAIYVAGMTNGMLEGQASSGRADGFVAKLDTDGALVWTRQIGSGENDSFTAITVDPTERVFVAGNAGGSIGAQLNAGFDDIVVAELDAATGEIIAINMLGTPQVDRATAIGANVAGVFVGGYSYGALGDSSFLLEDAVLIAFADDVSTTPLWIEQFGADGLESITALVSDGGDFLTMTGNAYDFTEGSRGFVQKFDVSSRTPVWSAVIENSVEPATKMSVTADAIAVDPATDKTYVVGSTLGPVDQNAVVGEDAYLVSYDADGNPR